MINFALPGMYEQANLNITFLRYFKNNPEKFHPEVNVNAVFGNFQFCIWDGGRIFHNYKQATKNDINNLINIYNNELNVNIRQIFTNNQLKPKHYHDRFGNLCLQLCENKNNEIVVANDEFENYIRTTYPNYKIISSTTKCLNKEETKKELQKDYKFICLDYNLNNNIDFLSALTEQEKNKIELLINAICPPGCPNRKEHYRLNSLSTLNYGRPYSIKCQIDGTTICKKTFEYKNNLSYQKIKEIYEPLGIQYYKIEGRTLPWVELLCNYVYYMVKPEYQLEVINDISRLLL